MSGFRTVAGHQVKFALLPVSPCPCGSGKAVAKCCLTSKGFQKRSARTSPQPPPTGYQHNGCYAAPLCDCSPKLSREHFVSAALLDYLNQTGGLRVAGFPWLDGEKSLPTSALASRMLCHPHNSALWPLDSIAVDVFQAFDERQAVGSGKQLIHLFSGHDLERWLLKILCGLSFSKNFGLPEGRHEIISADWLRILFGEQEFSGLQGLYMCVDIGHQFDGPRGLTMQAISSANAITGIGVHICGYELILSTAGLPNRTFDKRKFAFRPMELYASGPQFEKSVLFSWDGEADLGTISLTLQ